MGVVPWKHRFSGDIEMYRSRQRRKAEVAQKVRALEEQVATIEGAHATSQQQPLEARSVAQLETSSIGSQRRFNRTPSRRSRGNGCETLPRGRHRREDPLASFYFRSGKN